MKTIHLQRIESLLMELIPQALSSLNDSRINTLSITSVECKKGKYDATVFFDATDFTDQEIVLILTLLQKANGRIKSFCLASTGWYKCPNFKFIVDNRIEESRNLEAIFNKIKKTSNSSL